MRHFRRLEAGIHHLLAVQPVLHPIALHHQARMVELAHRFGRILRCCEDVVERRGPVQRAVVKRVGIGGIVRDLVLEADDVILTLGGTVAAPVLQGSVDVGFESRLVLVAQKEVVLNAIFQTAVAPRRNLPVPFELEIAVGVGAEEILFDHRMLGSL